MASIKFLVPMREILLPSRCRLCTVTTTPLNTSLAGSSIVSYICGMIFICSMADFYPPQYRKDKKIEKETYPEHKKLVRA